MRMSWGLESPQTLLTLAHRLVRVFGPIVQVPVLAVFHAGQRLLCRRAIAPQVVGHDHPWHIQQVLEQLVEELLGSLCVTLTLHENIQRSSRLDRRPPKDTDLHAGWLETPHPGATCRQGWDGGGAADSHRLARISTINRVRLRRSA
jgi:hypothetical protein